MKKFNLIFKIVFYVLLFFHSSEKAYCQSKELTKYIQEEIDELVIDKKYDFALAKLEELESYSDYISINENRLSLNFRKAEVFYGIKEEEKAMSLLLNGLNELEFLKLPKLKIIYAKYLGEIFWNSKDYNRSLDYFRNSLVNALHINDTISVLNSYINIGKAHSKNGQIDSAVHYYEKISNYPITKETENIVARSYTNLSAEAGEAGDLELAEEYSNKSVEIKKDQNDTLGIAYALVNLSGIKYLKEDYGEAEKEYLNAYKSLSYLNSHRAFKLKSDILFNLAYVNEELKKFDKAYSYLLEATELTDSLAQANIAKNISEIEAKYNVEKVAKEAEEEKSKRLQAQILFYSSVFILITLLTLSYIFYRNYRLKRENELDKVINETQIKIINATIDAKENERKSIAETLHDSVSALLSSANLHLQATKAQLKTGYPNEIIKAQTIVNEASVKIRDLSHELISSVLLKFGLAFAVHDMCQKYSNSEISLLSDDDGVKRYEQNFEIKIYNIIEELVNNILKHSKAKNATIMLAHRENNMLSIRMNDDGIGFDAKKAKTKGGLGLSHIEARIKVMKGVFNIVSAKDNGTSIFILVPIQKREA